MLPRRSSRTDHLRSLDRLLAGISVARSHPPRTAPLVYWKQRRRRGVTLMVCDATENDRSTNDGNGKSRTTVAETND